MVLLGEDVDLHELLRGAVLENLPAEVARLLKVNRVALSVKPVVRRRHAALQVPKLLLRKNPPKDGVLRATNEASKSKSGRRSK